nr:unnamed protein product [Spirometra erinaceieuropaei]
MAQKVIGTHDGTFHCDEVLAIAMLKQLPEYKNADIIRTREMAKLGTCDIVVDVGGLFDASSHRYDHGQPSFNLTIKDFHPHLEPVVKLSSAGLIYAHFGKRIISEIAGRLYSDADLETLFNQVYKSFISEVDAIDNGVPISDSPTAYQISTGLSSRVERLNPAWNKAEDESQCFSKALAMVTEELVGNVRRLAYVWLPAKAIVKNCFNSRFSVHPSGLIMRLTPAGCPWMEHFFELEKEQSVGEDAPSEKGQLPFIKRTVFLVKDGTKRFSVTTIPITLDQPFSNRCVTIAGLLCASSASANQIASFIKQSAFCRVMFPEPWAGKCGRELDKVVGISGCIFVHSNRFLGIHRTREGAVEMAKRALRAAGYL